MNRTTRKQVEYYLSNLNASILAETGINPHLGYTAWSPGDGWTRYQLTADYGSRTIGHVMRLGDFYSMLVGMCELRSIVRHLSE